MDELTRQVREMYMEFPFPSEEYRLLYGPQIVKYLHDNRGTKPRSLLDGADVLDAGCGTGSAAASMARQFPDARITAVDLSDASLAKARENAASKGLTNVDFRQANLLEMELGKKFDAIFCMGVLHHLSDPEKGLRTLSRHLKPGGVIVLWLYGEYGRHRLNLNQRLLQILLKDVESLQEKVEYTRKLLSSGDPESLRCYFSVHDPELEHKWEESLAWILGKPEWIVDQFLHYNERVFNMGTILAAADQTDLSLDKWIGVRSGISHLVKDPAVLERFEGLPERDRLLVQDLLIKPCHYTVALKTKNKE